MNGVMRRLASWALSASSRALPPHLASWSRAMESELAEIPDRRAAFAFAIGCLRTALTLVIVTRLRSVGEALFPPAPLTWSFAMLHDISARPRLLGLVCGAGAVASGAAYMVAAGAPPSYIAVNLAALSFGAAAWLALAQTARSGQRGAGLTILALATLLMLTALFGAESEGAARWVSVGPLSLQVSLIVLPAMIVLYARRPDRVGTAGMALAALALAGQPDRAMAGVLLASLSVLTLATRARLPIAATAAALLAFVWTLLAPDTLPAVPYVDRIFYTAFDVHPLAGLAVVVGAATLVLPALAALRVAEERSVLLTFGACWAGVVIAAALGNYPTPLVGYGGAAVLGYLLSVALLPNGAGERERIGASASRTAADRCADRGPTELRAAIQG